MIEEAQSIREQVPAPQTDIDPAEFLRLAALHRQAVDRLEALLGRAMLIRWQMANRRATAHAALEDAEVGLTVQFEEFTSARERDLKIKALTLDARQAVRTAERGFADAIETEKFLRLLHQGADNSRRDLDTRLRAISLASQWER